MGCCISKCHLEALAASSAPQEQHLKLTSPLPPLPQCEPVDLPPPSPPDDSLQNNSTSSSTTVSTLSSSTSRAASASNSSATSSSCCTSLSADSPLVTLRLATHGSPNRQRIVVLDPRRQRHISPDPSPATSAGPQLRKRRRSGSPGLTRQKSLRIGADPLPQRRPSPTRSRAPSPPVRRPPSPLRRLSTEGSSVTLAAKEEKLRRRSTPPKITPRVWGGHSWTRPNGKEACSRRVHPQAINACAADQKQQQSVVDMDCDDHHPDPPPRRPPPPVLEDASISLDCFIFI